MIVVYPTPSISVTATTIAAVPPSTPTLVQTDGQLLDDDGIPYVNPNVPGADIATGDKQSQQLAALQQIAAGVPVSQQGAWTVAVGSQPASALAPNAAQETAGQLQRVADLLEAVLLELKVISTSIVQLGQPCQDGPDVLRDDLNLLMQ